MSKLERFRSAQDSQPSGFQSALAEMQAGKKQGHWIWYVFPQLSGLGCSQESRLFAIDDEREATQYLQDRELRGRLLTITSAVAEQLSSQRTKSLRALMGSDIDARKLVSSLTLFGNVARKLHTAEGAELYGALAKVAEEVLATAAAEGYPPCAFTLQHLQPE